MRRRWGSLISYNISLHNFGVEGSAYSRSHIWAILVQLNLHVFAVYVQESNPGTRFCEETGTTAAPTSVDNSMHVRQDNTSKLNHTKCFLLFLSTSNSESEIYSVLYTCLTGAHKYSMYSGGGVAALPYDSSHCEC